MSITRLNNLTFSLPNIALKSDVSHQHSAVLVKNGKPLAWGFNSIKGSNTCHAEYEVISKYLSQQGYVTKAGKMQWLFKKQCLL